MKTKRITTYPPKKVVYRNASTSTTNNNSRNEPPAWLRTRDYLLTGGAIQFESRNASPASSSNSNMRSASNVNGKIPAWMGCAMYGTGTIAPSPSEEEIDKSLPYQYSESKEQHIRSRIMSAVMPCKDSPSTVCYYPAPSTHQTQTQSQQNGTTTLFGGLPKFAKTHNNITMIEPTRPTIPGGCLWAAVACGP